MGDTYIFVAAVVFVFKIESPVPQAGLELTMWPGMSFHF